jgi:hypothetical protein
MDYSRHRKLPVVNVVHEPYSTLVVVNAVHKQREGDVMADETPTTPSSRSARGWMHARRELLEREEELSRD